jgi:hypothetical protein
MFPSYSQIQARSGTSVQPGSLDCASGCHSVLRDGTLAQSLDDALFKPSETDSWMAWAAIDVGQIVKHWRCLTLCEEPLLVLRPNRYDGAGNR